LGIFFSTHCRVSLDFSLGRFEQCVISDYNPFFGAGIVVKHTFSFSVTLGKSESLPPFFYLRWIFPSGGGPLAWPQLSQNRLSSLIIFHPIRSLSTLYWLGLASFSRNITDRCCCALATLSHFLRRAPGSTHQLRNCGMLRPAVMDF